MFPGLTDMSPESVVDSPVSVVKIGGAKGIWIEGGKVS